MNPYLRSPLPPDFNLDKLLVPKALGFGPIKNLIDQLATHRMQVICAVTATEMVLWRYRPIEAAAKSVPEQAVEVVHRWLRGVASLEEIKTAAAAAEHAEIKASAATAEQAAADLVKSRVAASAASAVYSIYGGGIAGTAVRSAAYAVYEAAAVDGNVMFFFVEWWNKCKPLLLVEYQKWSGWLRGEV